MIDALLAGRDRRGTVGRRNYAILQLLARLGLRSSEVARISLDDVNWRAGGILVHGKGGREDFLPLAADVGEALAGYQQRRPSAPGGCRTLFLKVMPPPGTMSGYAVTAVAQDACWHVGIERFGAHRLRHAAASRMLAAGASLDEIGQVPRHRERRTSNAL
ncbi:tyrosine-type recombinase/integrase [Arthrobacter sp. A5]|uniref:tyrosine-type recombinase/integrase n=1 Tax=Arthrobacter sp. A5 TaxID=576926 RepID=UPI003DA92278